MRMLGIPSLCISGLKYPFLTLKSKWKQSLAGIFKCVLKDSQVCSLSPSFTKYFSNKKAFWRFWVFLLISCWRRKQRGWMDKWKSSHTNTACVPPGIKQANNFYCGTNFSIFLIGAFLSEKEYGFKKHAGLVKQCFEQKCVIFWEKILLSYQVVQKQY